MRKNYVWLRFTGYGHNVWLDEWIEKNPIDPYYVTLDISDEENVKEILYRNRITIVTVITVVCVS